MKIGARASESICRAQVSTSAWLRTMKGRFLTPGLRRMSCSESSVCFNTCSGQMSTWHSRCILSEGHRQHCLRIRYDPAQCTRDEVVICSYVIHGVAPIFQSFDLWSQSGCRASHYSRLFFSNMYLKGLLIITMTWWSMYDACSDISITDLIHTPQQTLNWCLQTAVIYSEQGCCALASLVSVQFSHCKLDVCTGLESSIHTVSHLRFDMH